MLHGFIHPDFSNVARVLRRILPRRGPGGAAVCGYHRVFAWRARVPGGFGHFGFGGSGAWADPQRQLAVGLTVNSGVGTPFGDTRIVRIGGAAARCADRR